MHAHAGNEVCSETIVIRTRGEWNEYVSKLRVQRTRLYDTDDLLDTQAMLDTLEPDHVLFALVGASS